jgi:hypothetical protein
MNAGRHQQWQAMKQQVRQRAGEAVIKRQQRPQFNRNDFIQQMKGRREPGQQKGHGQDGYKALRSEDRPKQTFEQDQLPEGFKPLRSGDRPPVEQFQKDRMDQPQNIGNDPKKQAQTQHEFEQKNLKQGPGQVQQGPGPGANAQANQPKPKIPVAPPRPRAAGARR